MATETATRALCEAGIGWRTELVDGHPKERIVICETPATGEYWSVDGRRHFFCPATGHYGSVIRRFPQALTGSLAWAEQ